MTAAGKLVGLDTTTRWPVKFTDMLASPLTMGFWMVVVVAIGIFVCARGQNGYEKVTKVMMIALLVIMVVLAVKQHVHARRKEGLTFFLVPDFERMKEVGIVNTLVGARIRRSSPEPRHRCNGHLRQLHRQRARLLGESVPRCGAGYLRRHHRRPHHLPGLLRPRWTRSAAPASSSSPCPTSSQIWRWAVCGVAYSSCS